MYSLSQAHKIHGFIVIVLYYHWRLESLNKKTMDLQYELRAVEALEVVQVKLRGFVQKKITDFFRGDIECKSHE